MGKHTEWIALLFHWFPTDFTDVLPEGTRVDAFILDGTQNLARIKTSKDPFNALTTLHHWINVINDYANNENDPTRVIIERALVVLLDTPRYVPKAKAATQQSRDGAGDDGDVDGDDDAHPDASVILDEAGYARLIHELAIDPENEYLIQREMKQCDWLHGTTVWRSNVLRWQLHSMVMSETLTRCAVPEGRVLVCDEAVVLASPDAYAEQRRVVLETVEGCPSDCTPLERETLIAHLLDTCLSRRHVRYSDGRVSPQASTGMGEADVKLCNYITLEQGLLRIMVGSQDSDIVLILLLHMKRLIAEAEALGSGGEPVEFSLFIDTQTPVDRASGVNRSTRFVNVCALYRDLCGLFAREYPCIANPVETFVALTQMLETDFTTRLAHKYTGVTRRVLWKTFSELHHDRHSARTDSYLVFPTDAQMKARKPRAPTEPMCRARTVQCSPKIHFVLGGATALRCEPHVLDPTEPSVLEYRLVLDEARVERFLYCVCQLRLVRELTALRPAQPGHAMRSSTSDNNTPLPHYDDVDMLFIYADDILRALAKYRQSKELDFKQSVESLRKEDSATPKTTTTKETKSTGKKPPRPLSAIMGDISLAVKHTPTISPFNTKELEKMVGRDIPPHYGIPSRVEMRARIRRLVWIMNYLQNASVCNLFSTCYADSVQTNEHGSHALSVYGWRARPLVKADSRALNSSYYETRLLKNCMTGVPLQVLTVEETDELAE